MSTVRQLFLVGDSLSAGKVGAHDYAQGGGGSWAEHDADLLANIPDLGPRISAGIRLTETGVTGLNAGEWTGTGAGTSGAATAFDKYPYGHGTYGFGGGSFARTYTVPAWMPPILGFSLYWIDMNDLVHVAGNWSYSINGGAWTAMGQTLAGDNVLKVFYVSATLRAGDTVQIRAATAANVDAYCFPVGIEPYFLPPTTAYGFICHNIAIGGTKLSELINVFTAGDRMALFDSVVAGTGSPIVPRPSAVLLEHINDIKDASVSTWNTNLTSFRTRVSPSGSVPLGVMSPWEVDFSGAYDQTQQTAHRAQTKTTAASFSPAVPVFDIYDEWGKNGWTGNAAVVAAGLLESDGIHENQAGHNDLTPRIFGFLRSKVLTIAGGPSSTQTPGKPAASSVYSARKAAATAYTGSLRPGRGY